MFGYTPVVPDPLPGALRKCGCFAEGGRGETRTIKRRRGFIAFYLLFKLLSNFFPSHISSPPPPPYHKPNVAAGPCRVEAAVVIPPLPIPIPAPPLQPSAPSSPDCSRRGMGGWRACQISLTPLLCQKKIPFPATSLHPGDP